MTLPPHIPDPFDIAPIQNVSEISDITTNTPLSITITTESNIVQISIHNITQNTLPNQNHTNNVSSHDGNSTISTSGTNVTQQLQTQQPSPRNYDPPSIPPQNSTQTMSHTSPQPGSSTHTTNVPQNPHTVQFNPTSPNRTLPLSIISYTPAQHTQTQNTQPISTINTLQQNPISNFTTSRNITRPPLQTIPTNPLSYNLILQVQSPILHNSLR